MAENILKNNDNILETAILNTVAWEVQKADNFLTRQAINLRVLRQVADILNLPWNYYTDSKSIYIHPENIQKIDEKWKLCLQGNMQASHDEMNAYEKIKSTDYIKIFDLVKFINIIVRKDTVERDPNSKEKILKSNDLNVLFGVDGFLGYTPAEIKNYIENLKYSNDENKHLNVVRSMYDLSLLRNLSGTDSSCIIYLSLLIVYKEFSKTNEGVLDELISDMKNYLMKNAQFYGDIQTALDQINDISKFYKESMNSEEIKEIAKQKISNIPKKRKNTFIEKRGRKKNVT